MQLSKIEQMNFASKMVDNTINTNKAIKQASANLREQLSSISVSSVEASIFFIHCEYHLIY